MSPVKKFQPKSDNRYTFPATYLGPNDSKNDFFFKFYIVQTLRAAGLILGIICRSRLNLSHESASPRARELNFLEREPKASPLPPTSHQKQPCIIFRHNI
jgi:hypothetical protein